MFKNIAIGVIISLGLIGCSDIKQPKPQSSGDIALSTLKSVESPDLTVSPAKTGSAKLKQMSDIKRLQELFDIGEEEATNMLESAERRAADLRKYKADRVKGAREKVRAKREAEEIARDGSFPDDEAF